MKTYYLILFSIILFSVQIQSKNLNNTSSTNNKVTTTTSTNGAISVDTWADNKKSAFSFTFDDSYLSQYENAVPILNQYGFHATFFVISGAVTDGPPEDWRYGYWWQFREMAAEGHEIAAHTVTHPDLTKLPVGDINTPNTLTYELYQSKKKIEEEIPGYKCISLAYPFCAYDSTVVNITSQYYQAARAEGNTPESPDLSGRGFYSVTAREVQFDLPRNSIQDDQDEFNTYTSAIENSSILKGKWSVYFAHEVVPITEISAGLDTTSWYPVSTEWLTQLCQWIKQKSDSNQIWVATFGNVVRYIKERNHFSYNIVSSGQNKIEISATTGLDTSIYNYPLTVDITVPNTWQDVSLNQGSIDTTVTPFNNGSSYVVRVNIIPGKDNLILNNGNSTYAVSGTVNYDNSSNSPIPNVEVKLLTGQNVIDSTSTNSSGKYEFEGIDDGNYSIELSKSNGWTSVNSTDALLTAKHFSEQFPLDSLQLKAADVNGNGKINSTDALIIAKRFVGGITDFSIPDWIFSGSNSIIINGSNISRNFKCIIAGDVNRSYKY